jgi:hypothetical protein
MWRGLLNSFGAQCAAAAVLVLAIALMAAR